MTLARDVCLFTDRVATPVAVLLISGVAAAFLWGLIYSAGRNEADLSQCQQRETECGFTGNPDIYGLGIRLGIYMQWFAGAIANVLLPSERRGIAIASVSFLLALEIAMLVLTFRPSCTYTAEIIIILFLLYGGIVFAFYEGFDLKSTRRSRQTSGPPQGLLIAFLPCFVVLLIFSSWFWLKVAQGHLGPFVDTPCGLSFFMFAHIFGDAVRPASIVLATLSLLAVFFFATGLAFAAFTVCELLTLAKVFFRYVMMPVIGALALVVLIPVVIVVIVGLGIPLIFYSCIMVCVKAMIPVSAYASLTRYLPDVEQLPELTDKLMSNKMTYTLVPAFSFAGLVLAIIAIELTIRWNNISGIYDLATTGQLIPFILGVIGIIYVFWRLWTEHERERERLERMEFASAEGYVVTRQMGGDSRWRPRREQLEADEKEGSDGESEGPEPAPGDPWRDMWNGV